MRDTDKLNVASSNNDAYTSFQVSGSNPAIIITAALNSSTGAVSSIALSAGLTGGTPYLCKRQKSGTTDLEIWAIPAPSGTGTITVNYSVTADHQSNAALFNNVSQTNPCSAADSVSVSGSTSPLNVTPTNVTSSDMVVYGGAQSVSGDAPHASSGTELFFGNNTSVNPPSAIDSAPAPSSVTWGHNRFHRSCRWDARCRVFWRHGFHQIRHQRPRAGQYRR